MSETKRVVIINGSPRPTEETTSEFLARLAETKIISEGAKVQCISARRSIKGDIQNDFDAMLDADTMVFIFPLYFFCVPGLLMRFLQDYAAYASEHTGKAKQHVYAVVNCGFPEAEINTEAIRVMKSFSRHIGAEFGFGVGLGGGGMLAQATNAPFMKQLMAGLDNTFARMAAGESGENVMLAPRFPRRLYFMMGGLGWRMGSRRNGLKNKELYRKPYMQ